MRSRSALGDGGSFALLGRIRPEKGATRAGGPPEIVEDTVTGYLCDAEADMVNAMRAVDQLNRRVCGKSVEDDFSADRMVRDHVDLHPLLDR